MNTHWVSLGSDIKGVSCNGFYFLGEIGDEILC